MIIRMLKMLGDTVLVSPIRKNVTKSGLALPTVGDGREHLKFARTAKVLSVGEKVQNNIRSDDVVFYEKMLDKEEKIFEYTIDDKTYMVLKEEQILAKLEEE